MKVTLEAVQSVARLLEENALAEIEITGLGEADGCRVLVRRAPIYHASAPDSISGQNIDIQPEDVEAPTPIPNESHKITVRANAVGVFHLPSGGLEIGAVVQARQAIGVIESLQIPNEVLAPADARVVEILVEDGQGVGYDQPLIELEPIPSSKI